MPVTDECRQYPPKIIFKYFCLGQAVSHPLCKNGHITKTKDYDDQRTNGTGARQSEGLQLSQASAAAVEPGKLVVSTDARSGGSRRRLAAGAPCPAGADLFSRVRFCGSRGSRPWQRVKGVRPRLGCHCFVCSSAFKQSIPEPPKGGTTNRPGQETGAPFRDLEGNHRAPVIAPQQQNRRANFYR